jgi:hypothetical protein
MEEIVNHRCVKDMFISAFLITYGIKWIFMNDLYTISHLLPY